LKRVQAIDAIKSVNALPVLRRHPGSIRDRIAIVGRAPGAVELTTGQPFSGRSGAELRRWLEEAGIDETIFHTAPPSRNAFRERPRPAAAIDVHRPRRSRSAGRGSIWSSPSFNHA
jgi:uracil-DNA glycosylase